MQRVVTLTLEDDPDLRSTIESFRIIQQAVSEIAAKLVNASSAIALHRKSYSRVRGPLKAQLTCTAIRSVAAAYGQRGDSKIKDPIQFNKPRAMFLIGKAKRDASINKDGTVTVWTIGGRKRLKFTVPQQFKSAMAQAESFDALCVAISRGRLHATLSVTLPDPECVGALPVGVNLNDVNAIAAIDMNGRSMCVTGVAHRAMMKSGEKTRRRLEDRLSTRKAEGRETRSVRRLLKRLGRKRYLQTKTFCSTAAKSLVDWVGPRAVIVLEDFRHQSPSRRKLPTVVGPVFYENIRHRIESRAAASGIAVAYVDPLSNLPCSRCGSEGSHRRGQFTCPHCAFQAPVDKNAATNVRNKYTVFKAVGCSQPAPKLDIG